MRVVHAPQLPARAQQAAGVVEQRQRRVGILRRAAVEGRIGDDRVEARLREVTGAVDPERLDVDVVLAGCDLCGRDGRPAHVDARHTHVTLREPARDGPIAAAEIQHIGAVDVEHLEQELCAGVDLRATERRSVRGHGEPKRVVVLEFRPVGFGVGLRPPGAQHARLLASEARVHRGEVLREH